jgi:hypothetical protein
MSITNSRLLIPVCRIYFQAKIQELAGFRRIPQDSLFSRRNFFTGTSFLPTLIHILRSFLQRLSHTNRFPDVFLTIFLRNRNYDSSENTPTGRKNIGIHRNPAEINNLGGPRC